MRVCGSKGWLLRTQALVTLGHIPESQELRSQRACLRRVGACARRRRAEALIVGRVRPLLSWLRAGLEESTASEDMLCISTCRCRAALVVPR